MARYTDQLYAVAKLIGYCESVVGSGLLSETMESRLRECIAEALTAFDMEPHQIVVRNVLEQA